MKKLFFVLILTLALNFLALGGAVGYLFQSGRLNKDKTTEAIGSGSSGHGDLAGSAGADDGGDQGIGHHPIRSGGHIAQQDGGGAGKIAAPDADGLAGVRGIGAETGDSGRGLDVFKDYEITTIFTERCNIVPPGAIEVADKELNGFGTARIEEWRLEYYTVCRTGVLHHQNIVTAAAQVHHIGFAIAVGVADRHRAISAMNKVEGIIGLGKIRMPDRGSDVVIDRHDGVHEGRIGRDNVWFAISIQVAGYNRKATARDREYRVGRGVNGNHPITQDGEIGFAVAVKVRSHRAAAGGTVEDGVKGEVADRTHIAEDQEGIPVKHDDIRLAIAVEVQQEDLANPARQETVGEGALGGEADMAAGAGIGGVGGVVKQRGW